MCAAAASGALPLRPRRVDGTTLADLRQLAAAGGVARLEPASASQTVTGITLRAQHVQPGDLFAARPGHAAHGAQYAALAVERGAVAVLTDQSGWDLLSGLDLPALVVGDVGAVLGELSAAVYGRPSRRLDVLGVTGTSGKTTTTFFLEAALRAGGVRTGLIGTVGTHIDGEPTPSALTTPEAPELQALFAVMVEREVRAVAMEVSSHSLSLGRVSGIHYRVAGFLNLSQDHLDFHADMEDYFAAKAKLFDARSDRAVVNVDDDWGRRLAAARPDAVTVAGEPDNPVPADWRVRSARTLAGGLQTAELSGPGGDISVSLALPGRYNAANAAMALACLDVADLGVDTMTAAAALAGAVVPGRMERIPAGEMTVVVDYAHKPAALSAMLAAMAFQLSGRLIVVVGAGGDRDRGKRTAMGAAAAAWADILVVTDDNPRSEPPAVIRAAVLDGARRPGDRFRPGSAEVFEVGNRREAIDTAVRRARPGDVVIIAGKGHEPGQEIAGVVYSFSDREEAARAIAAVGAAS